MHFKQSKGGTYVIVFQMYKSILLFVIFGREDVIVNSRQHA